MSRAQKLRCFVNQRLNAALEEIFAAFEQTIAKYEQEAALCQEVISRQHALLCALHKPLMETSSTDAFTQHLMVGNKPNRHQVQQNPHVEGEQKGKRLSDPEEADIVQFTYNVACMSKPAEEPGSEGPHQEVQLVSSETEDSDDYSKDSALEQVNPKTTCRPGPLSCRVCSWTGRANRFLFRHIKTHLREPDLMCGLCGEQFQTPDSLRIHIQTHEIPRRKRRELQNRTRSRRSKSQTQQHPNLNKNPRVHENLKPMDCEDGNRRVSPGGEPQTRIL